MDWHLQTFTGVNENMNSLPVFIYVYRDNLQTNHGHICKSHCSHISVLLSTNDAPNTLVRLVLSYFALYITTTLMTKSTALRLVIRKSATKFIYEGESQRPGQLQPLSTLTIRSEPSWSQLRVKCEKDRTPKSAIRESPTAVHKARPLFFHWLRQISQATKMCIIRCLRLPAVLCAASAPAVRMKQRWFSTGSAEGTSAAVSQCVIRLRHDCR